MQKNFFGVKSYTSFKNLVSTLFPITILLFTSGLIFYSCQSLSDPKAGKGAYATGKYRNLFLENGHSQKEIDAKINKTFNQLFHGDSAQVIYFEAGENKNGALAFVSDIGSGDVRSEGMSYGMMITVQMDKKAEFDALWNWALSYMYVTKEGHKMILFVPDIGREGYTDPSYHLPAFYELWARWGPEKDREFWAEAADSSRAFFSKNCNPETGLCTDYANFDGAPVQSRWNGRARNFAYDSWRTESNWSVDWPWWQKAPNEVELSNRLQNFFASFGVDSFGHMFTPPGEVLNSRHRARLVATTAVTSLAADHSIANDFVEEFWNTPIPESHGERYYDGTLYMMSLLHCSGEFKIWKPKK